MASKKAKPALPAGWNYNEKGEACFRDDCFTITATPDRAPKLEWEPHCDIEAANDAERALLAAMGRGEGMVYSRKPPGGKDGR